MKTKNFKVTKKIIVNRYDIPKDMTEESFYINYNDYARVIDNCMSIVNMCTFFCLGLAIDECKSIGIFKQTTKHLLNKAMSAFKNQSEELKYYSCHGNDFFLPKQLTDEELKQGYIQQTRDDLFDRYELTGSFGYQRAKKHFDILRIQIWQDMAQNNVKNREALSYVAVAALMSCYACSIFSNASKQCDEVFQQNISRDFLIYKFVGVKNYLVELAKKLKLSQYLIPKDCNNNIKNAFKALDNNICMDIQQGKSQTDTVMDSADTFGEKFVDDFIQNCIDLEIDEKKQKEIEAAWQEHRNNP